jgi:hypothetical protein
MNFYWSIDSLPELRDVPAKLRHQIAEEAIQRLRVSLFSGTVIIGFMLATGAAALIIAITIGNPFVVLVSHPVFHLIKPLLLNLARSQIREMLDRMYR